MTDKNQFIAVGDYCFRPADIVGIEVDRSDKSVRVSLSHGQDTGWFFNKDARHLLETLYAMEIINRYIRDHLRSRLATEENES